MVSAVLSNSQSPPTVRDSSIGTFGGLTPSYTKHSITTGLIYAIQESSDLGATDVWEEISAGPFRTNNASTISYTLPGGPPKDFPRLNVQSN